MKVRLTIDRVVVEGLELSAAERMLLLEHLREGLREAVIARVGARPVPRRAARERVALAAGQFGKGIGKAIVEQVWSESAN